MAKDTGLHSQLANELKGMDRRKSRVFDSLLVVTAAIALALAAVVLYVGFGGGNIADLSAMSLDDILDLYGSLFAGEVGKGLSIFGWACVLLAAICVLGVLRRFCPYFYNSMKVVRGWMSYSALKKTLRTDFLD